MHINIDRVWKKNVIILFICLILGGIIGIVNICPVEFDFLNYRYYIGWAFWNHRIDIDIMPATFRTYFNPILDAINYLLIDKLTNHPYVYLFISGLKFGLFMFLSYLIYDLVLTIQDFDRKFIIFSAMVLTAFSPLILFTAGYGYTDIQPAILVMLSFYIYLRTIFENRTKKNKWLIFLTALITGAAVGLKYTQATFGIALILYTIFYRKKFQFPLKTILIMLAGMFIGFLITGGYWMWTLWTHFHNPLFPYFNSLFHSPMADYDTMFATDFSHLRPHNLFDFFFGPLRNPLQENVGIEMAYFDLKIQLSFILITFYFILNKFINLKDAVNKVVKPDFFNILLFITIANYYFNLLLFGQIRYILYLFAIISLIIIVLCYVFCSKFKFSNSEPNIFNILLILFISFYAIRKPMEQIGFNLKPVLIVLIAAYLCFILINCFAKQISNNKRNTYIGISFCILSMLVISRFIDYPTSYYKIFKAVQIKNLHLKDNSNVIFGTMLTNFIAPKQNPNVKYYGFAIPEDYEKDSYWTTTSPFHNMLYKNKYLEKQLKKAFNEDKPLYFIYSYHGIADDRDKDIYDKSIKYYSNNTVSQLKNCKIFYIQFFNIQSYYGDFYICKLK